MATDSKEFEMEEANKMKGLRKRVKRWLTSGSDDPLFGADEEGKDVFYPWGAPGESFYVNGTQKKQIMVFFYTGLAFLCISVFALFFFEFQGTMSYQRSSYAGSALFLVIAVSYIFAMYQFKRGKTFCAVPVEKRNSRDVIFLFVLFVWLPMGMMITGSRLDDSAIYTAVPLIIIFLAAVCAAFISYVLFKIYKTKGYYFSAEGEES